jgi:hypothetical protein
VEIFEANILDGGPDPAVLPRNYAKRIGRADDRAAAVIRELSKGSLPG